MAATLSTRSPIERAGRYIYEVTLAAVNDTVTITSAWETNFADYPVIAHIKRGAGDTVGATYSLDPDLSSGSFISTSYGNFAEDKAVVFDYFAAGYRITKSVGSGSTVVYLASDAPLEVTPA